MSVSEAGEWEIWKGMRLSTGMAGRVLDQRLRLSRLLAQVCADRDKPRPQCREHVEERVSGEPLMDLFSTPMPGRARGWVPAFCSERAPIFITFEWFEKQETQVRR